MAKQESLSGGPKRQLHKTVKVKPQLQQSLKGYCGCYNQRTSAKESAVMAWGQPQPKIEAVCAAGGCLGQVGLLKHFEPRR